MNKIVLGIIVLIVGGLIGWYYLGGTAKIPGMKIGGPTVSPASLGISGVDVTITDESPVAGSEKGGVAGQVIVSYTDSGYQPKEVTVAKGTSVTFRNDSSFGMWTASAVHPTHQLLPGFDQLRSVARGGMYEYTFVKVGTWKYHNHVKPTDTGTVVVTE